MTHDPTERELLRQGARIAELELRLEELAALVHLLQRRDREEDA